MSVTVVKAPEHILKLQKELAELNQKAQTIRDILTLTCKKDGHIMTDDGHDSHYNWEKCVVCGHRERN